MKLTWDVFLSRWQIACPPWYSISSAAQPNIITSGILKYNNLIGWLVWIYKFLLPLPPQPPTKICLISVWRLPLSTHRPGRNLQVRIWQYHLSKAKKADQIKSALLDKYNQLNWAAIMSRIIESCSDFKCHLSIKGFNSSNQKWCHLLLFFFSAIFVPFLKKSVGYFHHKM